MLNGLQAGVLTRVLRPTLLVAAIFGAVGVGVAALLNAPYAALGIVAGVGLAVLNVRMLAAGVTRVEMDGSEDRTATKAIKRVLRMRSAARLVVLTAVAIGAMLLSPQLGIGVVVGLVMFQIAFVFNAGRVVLREGIQ